MGDRLTEARATSRAPAAPKSARRVSGSRPHPVPLESAERRRQRADGHAGQGRRVVPATAVTQIDRKSTRARDSGERERRRRPVGDVSAEIEAGIAKIPLPPGYRLSMGGAAADIEETTGQASVALVLAVIFIYMILASQFAVVHCSRSPSWPRCRCRWSACCRTPSHGLHAQHVLDHRLHHADGARDEECDPARGLRQPGRRARARTGRPRSSRPDGCGCGRS